jgi:hypothetical protein
MNTVPVRPGLRNGLRSLSLGGLATGIRHIRVGKINMFIVYNPKYSDFYLFNMPEWQSLEYTYFPSASVWMVPGTVGVDD